MELDLRQLDLIDYPFDQYQRYRITQEIVDLIRQHLDLPQLSVLDVGGYFRAVTGREILPIAQFLPNDRTVALDLTPCVLPSYVWGSGSHIPFASGSFDVVSTCDTLEHVPPGNRQGFLGELLRVAAHFVILAAPFDDERTRLGEQIIFNYVKAFYNTEQPQLKEHIQYGLPDRDELREWLTQWGYAFTDFSSGYLHHWLPMMLLKQYLFGHPGTERLHLKIDRFYNRNFYHLDHRTPGYRQVFVVSKLAHHADLLAEVARDFAPAPASPGDDGVAFARSLLTLVEWEREWQREQTRKERERQEQKLFEAAKALNANAQVQELAARAKELDALRDLVARCIHPGIVPRTAQGTDDVLPSGEGILVIPALPIDRRMHYAATRCLELARVLGREHSVTVAGVEQGSVHDPDLELLPSEPEEGWEALVKRHRIVFAQGTRLLEHPELSRAIVAGGKYLVVDLYDAFPVASLPGLAGDASGVRKNLIDWSSIGAQVRLADFLVCSGEHQRDFWLGMLGAQFRLNPHTYANDPAARHLIDVVPFGLPADPPVSTQPVLKGVHSRVSPNDKLAVWTGEVGEHTDPLTLVKAWVDVVSELPDAKLFFFSPDLYYAKEPATAMGRRAVSLSKELGLHNRSVFFHPSIAYEDRGAYLLEADLGVFLLAPGLASRYASSVPLLDYVWAGLPIVTGSGSFLGKLAHIPHLAMTIEQGDVSGLKDAVVKLLREPPRKDKLRPDLTGVANQLTWERVAEPLVRYCRSPWRAADKREPNYAEWSSTVWQRLLMDRVYSLEQNEQLLRYSEQLLQHIEALRSGRVMRLTRSAEELWRRVRGESGDSI